MSEFKRLESLVEYMNDNDSIFGWKSRCEALTELAESLEAELADKDRLIDQLKNCYNCKFELHAAKECETCNTADCDDSHHYETSNWQPKEPEAAERGGCES